MQFNLLNPKHSNLLLVLCLGGGYWVMDWIGLAFGILVWLIISIVTGATRESKLQKFCRGLTQSQFNKVAFTLIENKKFDEYANVPQEEYRFSKEQFHELLLPICLLVWLSISGFYDGHYGNGALIGFISFVAIGSQLFPTLAGNTYIPTKEKVCFVFVFYILCVVLGFLYGGFGSIFLGIILFGIGSTALRLK